MKKQKSINIKDTPTRVGKRAFFVPFVPFPKDDSHSRGKKSSYITDCIFLKGLLPLAWEKVYCESISRDVDFLHHGSL